MFDKHLIKLIKGLTAFASIFAASTAMSHHDLANRDLTRGEENYQLQCASCHGVNLEGQPNWRDFKEDGSLPAPPHDETGHTWHHTDYHLFMLTKYGIEEFLNMDYPNNMPAYNNLLTNDQIIAVLSYIKSQWPSHIRIKHAQLNKVFKEN